MNLIEWFISFLFNILETKDNSLINKLETLLLSVWRNSHQNKILNLQFAITYFFERIKIEKYRDKIEQLKKYKNCKDIHIISLSLITNTEQLVQTITKDDFYDEYIELQTNKNKLKIQFKNSFKNKLKYIESKLNYNYSLFQEVKYYGNFASRCPKNLFDTGKLHPFIIYNLNYINDSFPEEINYISNTYKLGGIYFLLNEQEIILLRNKEQSLWFNIEEVKYENSIDSYLNKIKYQNFITFYLLSENNNEINDFSLELFLTTTKDKIEFSKSLKRSVKWLIENNTTFYIKHRKYFKQIFDIDDIFEFQYKQLSVINLGESMY